MFIFRRSLAEDSADSLSHMVAVLFLLLSLVSWLLPLSMNLQLPFSPGSQETDSLTSVNAKIKCWCPEQFSSSQVIYTNTLCEKAFNLAVHGIEPKSRGIDVDLFELVDENELIPKYTVSGIRSVEQKFISTDSRKKQAIFRILSDKISHFVYVRTPLSLFLLAVCLKIPYLLWALLTSFVGGLNINKTLVAAEAGVGLDHRSQRRLLNDIARAAADNVRSCPWKITFLYLLQKVLTCLAILAELFIVHRSLLLDAKKLGDGPSPNAIGGLNGPFFCTMKIRHLYNVHDHTIQCGLTEESVQMASAVSSPHPLMEHYLYEMYETLYLIVATLLVVLAVVSLSSLFAWVAKLIGGPCRTRVGSKSGIPLDIILLLHMAEGNVGPEVVQALAQGKREKESDDIELKE